MSRLRYCRECRRYTLQHACATCGAETVSPHPPRFSPEDRYGAYRRKLRKELMEEAGWSSG
ncbi:MAG: RNA-protein complex protein Nop10 [Euryarchaeota archaeon]|nr:RNA-protein complex protein Nop10 [Euryarchaeota archaeon]